MCCKGVYWGWWSRECPFPFALLLGWKLVSPRGRKLPSAWTSEEASSFFTRRTDVDTRLGQGASSASTFTESHLQRYNWAWSDFNFKSCVSLLLINQKVDRQGRVHLCPITVAEYLKNMDSFGSNPFGGAGGDMKSQIITQVKQEQATANARQLMEVSCFQSSIDCS
jgi:hypothetical protein